MNASQSALSHGVTLLLRISPAVKWFPGRSSVFDYYRSTSRRIGQLWSARLTKLAGGELGAFRLHAMVFLAPFPGAGLRARRQSINVSEKEG